MFISFFYLLPCLTFGYVPKSSSHIHVHAMLIWIRDTRKIGWINCFVIL